MTESIGTSIHDEIKRNYELLEGYHSIGPAGAFGAAMIQADLDAAHAALKKENVIEILQAYARLADNK